MMVRRLKAHENNRRERIELGRDFAGNCRQCANLWCEFNVTKTKTLRKKAHSLRTWCSDYVKDPEIPAVNVPG